MILLAALLLLALVLGAGAAGYLLASPAGTPEATVPYLDDEYTFLGAVRSWPAERDSARTNPFPGVEDPTLVAHGRTVCARAGDPGMHFDGMLHLLRLDPHQTFVVVTEAIDKLCPSQRRHLTRLTS